MKQKSSKVVRKYQNGEQKPLMASQLFSVVGKGRGGCIDWRQKLMKYTPDTRCTFLWG